MARKTTKKGGGTVKKQVGGLPQGYNARLDESLAARHPAVREILQPVEQRVKAWKVLWVVDLILVPELWQRRVVLYLVRRVV